MERPSTSKNDPILLALCVISLGFYLLFSQAIPAFAREVVRLLGRV